MAKQCKFVTVSGQCEIRTIFKGGICRGHCHSKCHFCGEQAFYECARGEPDYCGKYICKDCHCDCLDKGVKSK